jgi:hypothetical protein
MKSKIRILFMLFALGFIFAATFNIGTKAHDPIEYSCIEGTIFSCCIDSLGRHGAMIPVRSAPDTTDLKCVCDGVPGFPTINGPCNCQMDCYEFSNEQ